MYCRVPCSTTHDGGLTDVSRSRLVLHRKDAGPLDLVHQSAVVSSYSGYTLLGMYTRWLDTLQACLGEYGG